LSSLMAMEPFIAGKSHVAGTIIWLPAIIKSWLVLRTWLKPRPALP
jgi:hypothetical protein